MPPISRARLLMMADRLPEAIGFAQAALELNPADAESLFVLGYCQFLTQQTDDALTQFNRLIDLEPNYPDAQWMRAGVLLRLYGEHDPRVLPAYDAAVALDPANAYAQTERAGILRALGCTEEAKTIYQQFSTPDANDDEPLRVECLFQLGCVCMVLGQNAEAYQAFQAVLDLAPDYPDADTMRDLTQE